jgi:hypothetical protein
MENTSFSWECYDRPHHDRGPMWFAVAFMIGLGLLIYAVLSANFLFAFIIILFALVTYLSAQAGPVRITCAVEDGGIRVGNDLYPFREIRRFWFVYQPPEVRNLYFETSSWIHPRISLDLENANPNDIRTALGQFVREDLQQDEEPMSDYLTRILKL